MKKNALLDFLIIVFVYLALSCFPFGLIIRSEDLSWLIITLQIVTQIILLVFIILFTIFKTKLDHKIGKINIINTLLLIPTLVVCFSNFTNMRIATCQSSISFDTNLILNIVLTLFIVINEEIIFRLLFINNLEFKKNIYIILLTAGVFGICHLTHFFSTFDPSDLVIVLYTFLLGLLLGFAYLFSKSIIPCFVIHFLFNLLNNLIFPYFVLEWKYILITSLFVLIVAIYVVVLFFIKSLPNKESQPANE